jgi:ABC-2 type transport system permease protein
LLFGLPVAQILLFGFALTNEIKHARMVISDGDHSRESRELIALFQANPIFEVETRSLRETELTTVFRREKVALILVIPANFNQELHHARTAQLQLIADASDPNTATTLVSYATTMISTYESASQASHLLNPQQQALPLKVETRMMYNPGLHGATNFVPGLMAFVLFLVSVLMTSVSIVREKEMGTMEMILVSPFHPLMVIIAKMVPYFLISLVNLGVILWLSITLLDMPQQGSLALLVLMSILYIFTALSVGLLISNVTASQQIAMFLSVLGMLLPVLMFTGFMFPLENMPLPLQYFANVIPSKWYYIIVKDIMIKGLGWSALWKPTLILSGMCASLILVSVGTFKTRLA